MIIRWLIEKFTERGITGKDMNKKNTPDIPEMGGVGVVMGTIFGTYLLFALYDIFDIGPRVTFFHIASILTLMGIAMIGMLDDLVKMNQATKGFLPFVIALPLGNYIPKIVTFPLVGDINFGVGIFIIVPLSVTCAANSTNMLEGFNGLGAGLGIIIVSALTIMAIINDLTAGLYFYAPLLGALLAFYYFNKFPAKIFPGDTMTLFLGASIACGAYLSDLKFETLLLLSPMVIEFFLKMRGKFEGECFGKVDSDDMLSYSGRTESLTHVVMKRFHVNEKSLVRIFFMVEGLLAVIVISLNWFNII